MITPRPTISVAICTYTEERWDDLVAAVESVQRQSVAAHEIIIVVDHNPRLRDRARAAWPGLVVIENREPRGLGGARNSAVGVARGEVIVFLDDDAVADPVWLEKLSDGYQDARVVGVGGAITPAWQGQRPAWFPEEFLWVVGCTYRGMSPTAAPVRNLIGANMSFRRTVFEAIGRFQLGYGCDETEFCIRVHQRWPDAVLLYEPQARVAHRVSSSRTSWRYFRSRCYFEGRSKAVVAWLRGARDGLDSERAYTLQTLPQGVLAGLADTIMRRDRSGLARAWAIAAGLMITTAGYLTGRVSVVKAARERGWVAQAQ